jgi:hypothetical protein
MSTVTVSEKYADILAPLGDVQQAVDEALRHYVVVRIGQRIAELRRQIHPWEEEYDCTYEVFYVRVTGDEEYVANLRQSHPTWERDFQQWEFYVEEMREWISRLESISTS